MRARKTRQINASAGRVGTKRRFGKPEVASEVVVERKSPVVESSAPVLDSLQVKVV